MGNTFQFGPKNELRMQSQVNTFNKRQVRHKCLNHAVSLAEQNHPPGPEEIISSEKATLDNTANPLRV
jgi:hypothetical protein